VCCLLTALIAAGCTTRDRPEPDHAPAPVAAGRAREHVAAGALRGRTGAYLTVRDAASRVEVRLADLPGLLYRITTPVEAGLAPQVIGPAGRPGLRLRPTGDQGSDSVTILLNRGVRWDIRLPAGAGEQHLDLREGRLARVVLGSAGLVDLRLPRPRGAVPITLAGPVGSVALTAPARALLRVRFRAGASRTAVTWSARRRAAPGETLAARGWAVASDRYAVEVRGPVETFTVRN
jgi:hypothetical protein